MRERIEEHIDVIADNVILSDWLDQMLEDSEHDS
jgi:RNase H-fold protein (predicted Holliday junction resolvase)